jgi:hypothetical protein
MAKLIGTDPNQVPTNADLGTMAYQDSTNTVLENAYINAKGADGLEMGEDYTSPNNSSRLFFNSSTATGNWAIFNNSGSLKFQSGASAGSTSGNYVSVALSTTGMVLAGDVQKPNQPAFQVYCGTNETTASGSPAPYNALKVNNGSHYNTTNRHFVAPVGGRYQFNTYGNINQPTATASSGAGIAFYVNGIRRGGIAYWTLRHPSDWYNISASAVIDLSANDYVDVRPTHQSLHWDYGSDAWGSFSGFLIG